VVPVYAGLGIEEEETIVDNAPLPRTRYKAEDYQLMVIFGNPLTDRPSLDTLRQEVRYLGRRLRSLTQAGITATSTVMIPGALDASPTGKAEDRRPPPS